MGQMLLGHTDVLRRPEGTAMTEPRGRAHLPVLPKARSMFAALAGQVTGLPFMISQDLYL